MSLTNVTKGVSKEIDKDSQQQTSAQNRNEQPTSSGIQTQINIKLTAVSREKPIAHSSSLSSLDELAARLKEQLDKDDIQKAVSIKTNSLILSSENLTDDLNLKKIASGRSLNELSQRLMKLKNNKNSSTGSKIHTSISMAVASGSTKSRSNSISSMENLFLKEREMITEDESFVTVEPCQKEKMTGTDAVTIFSTNNRTQNVIVARSDYANRPPPPYEYIQRNVYQGNVGQTPVYQMQNMNYGMGVTQDASRAPPYRRGDMNIENVFNFKEIRNNFVRKVYMILAMQLLFTFGSITFSIYNKTTKEFMRRQWLLAIISMIGYIVLLIALFCYTKIRRIYPLNFILLALLTFFMAFSMAFVSCYYNTKIVMISMGATAGICTLITLLACTPWFDITECGMMLCIAGIIIIIYGIIALIISMITGSNIAYIIYACLITILFCMYLMYDTQQILGGRRVELSPEEYILGAVTLYVDIMVIFQNLLSLISNFG